MDSEGPIAEGDDPWVYVQQRDGWRKPVKAQGDDLHFMVQTMEAYFIADPKSLQNVFGQGYKPEKLPQNPKPEQVEKTRIIPGIQSAIRNCEQKRYTKGRHSFEALEACDPAELRNKMPFFKRFIERLESLLK